MTIENIPEDGLPQSKPAVEPTQTPLKKPLSWTQSPGAKFIMVGFITVILLVPALLVWGIVDERSRRATSVANSISQGWGGQQTLNGPFLVLPYAVDKTVGDKVVQETRQAVFSAEKMSFDADVDVEERRKSIYSIPLFQGKFKMKGRFAAADLKSIRAVNGRPDFENAFLAMGVSDNSGFRSDVLVKLDGGKALSFEPGLGQLRNKNRGGGIHLPLSNVGVGKAFDFEIDMVLNGSRSLTVVPAGKNTALTVKSNWPHPGFDGRFLPLKRDISESGFTATWSVPYLARGIGSVWLSSSLPPAGSVVAINFVEPLKFYQIITRTLKYSIAFFALTFLAVFILEQTGRKAVHWIQYILAGLAMVIFYVLLLALAEHVGFNIAYLVSAVATTGLIAWYVGDALGQRHSSLIMGAVLGVSYLIVFLVLKEQEYALLAGAAIAFGAIATTMYATRKVDWTGKG